MSSSSNLKDSDGGDHSMTYMRSDMSFHSATPLEPMAPAMLYNFISLLAVAQHRQISFLPITWQPALDRVGLGGTSEIRQSFIKLQTSFAFKRIKHSERTRLGDSIIFQTLLSEVTVLSHPSIKDHPNIVKLLGICWDISQKGTVWPVLVSEKAQFGNLKEFSVSEAGKGMSLDKRLKICAGIATAIRDMHTCHIIHGDIKPENILIMKDETGEYIARVTDFGYSTVYTGHGRIVMPRTNGWDAPEWGQRGGFTFSEAQKMDAYSFGLVCFWFLIYKLSDPFDPITLRRQNEDMAACARKLIETQWDLRDPQRERLSMLFSLTLANKPENRSSDFDKLISCLAIKRSNPLNLSTHDMTDISTLPAFSIGKSAWQFYQSDIRVRKYIAEVLQMYTPTIQETPTIPDTPIITDTPITRDYAFQLALCFKLGFGVAKSTIYDSYLHKSQYGSLALQNEIDQVIELSAFQEPILSQFVEEGYIRLPSLLEQSLTSEERETIMHESERELVDIQQEMSEDHELVRILKSRLVASLRSLGRWKEAEKLQQEVLESFQKRKGLRDQDILNEMNDLAHIYKDQEQWDKSEKLDIQILETTIKIWGMEHLHTVSSMANLATTHKKLGRVEKAEEMETQAWKTSLRVCGEQHAVTLNIMANLASTYDVQERWEEAKEIETQVMEIRVKAFGADHPATLIAKDSLASTYARLGNIEEAVKLSRQVVEMSLKTLGKEHPDTLRCMANLASHISTNGEWEEAAILEVQILEVKKKVLGVKDRRTLISMANLASTYFSLERFEEAGTLQKEVMQIREQTLGVEHSETLESKEDLACIYMLQGRLEEAEELGFKFIKAGEKMQESM